MMDLHDLSLVIAVSTLTLMIGVCSIVGALTRINYALRDIVNELKRK